MKLPLSEIKPNPSNPRIIQDDDFKKLVKSLKEFPEMLDVRELVLNKDHVILGGNMRYKAAQKAGLTELPVKIVDWPEDKQREFIIKDNVSGGEWDWEALANEWDADELDDWGVKGVKSYKDIDEVEAPEVDESNIDSKVGSIYTLGRHKLYCGSFADDDAVSKMFGDKKADATFTDPPYNIDYHGSAGNIKNDSMGEGDFQEFLDSALQSVKDHMKPGGGVISWMSDTELNTLIQAYRNNNINFKTIIVWVKNTFTLGRADFQSQKEPAVYGIDEGSWDDHAGDESNDSEVAAYGRGSGSYFTDSRKVSNTWFFPKPVSSKDHPTMKPIALCAKGVLAIAPDHGIVYDPFSGSGSTLIACEQTNRACYGCELDPKFCDVIRKRWWKMVNNDNEEGWEEATKEEL